MSRKWTEALKPVRCKDCDGYCPDCVCVTENHPIVYPDKWRYCKSFIPIRQQKSRT